MQGYQFGMTKRVTIKDVAREAGVSTALVSYVLSDISSGRHDHRVNPETARRIIDVAARLEYRPNNTARTLRIGRTMTIGVIMSDIANPFFSEIARCIENKAYDYNYSALFGSTDENPAKLEKLLHVFLNKNVDGVIIVPCDGAESAIREVVSSGLPVVLLDREIPGENIPSVVLDNYKAGQKLAETLVSKGKRRIEMVSYAMKLSNFRDREAGYMHAMEQSGNSAFISVNNFPYDNFAAVRPYVLDAHERGVEALLCATNTLASNVLKEIIALGYTIPEDFAIASFDDNPAFSIYGTSVSFVRQPIQEFGTAAVDLVVNLINKGNYLTEKNIILAPSIVSSEE